MKILLSNDDGFNSPGIKILENALKDYGNVILAAPNKNVSACSSSLSVHNNIKIKKIDSNHYIVYGTPADCVHVLSRGIMKSPPDIVFSGINYGSNMGDDVIYSGTVAAAIEGRFYKYSPIAISIASSEPKHLNDIDIKIEFIIKFIMNAKYMLDVIFNINIPDIPLKSLRGIKFTTLGKRTISKKPKINYENKIITSSIGPVGRFKEKKSSSDIVAIESGYISITPITTNMCDIDLYKKLSKKNVKFKI